jgi:hypothetical protein
VPLPIILTHGYPDSFLRFAKIIPMLNDPEAHGGDASDAFDVVAPSGHFAAMEQPELLVDDIRAFFPRCDRASTRALRTSRTSGVGRPLSIDIFSLAISKPQRRTAAYRIVSAFQVALC